MAYDLLPLNCGQKSMFAFWQLFKQNSLSVNSHMVKYVIIKC